MGKKRNNQRRGAAACAGASSNDSNSLRLAEKKVLVPGSIDYVSYDSNQFNDFNDIFLESLGPSDKSIFLNSYRPGEGSMMCLVGPSPEYCLLKDLDIDCSTGAGKIYQYYGICLNIILDMLDGKVSFEQVNDNFITMIKESYLLFRYFLSFLLDHSSCIRGFFKIKLNSQDKAFDLQGAFREVHNKLLVRSNTANKEQVQRLFIEIYNLNPDGVILQGIKSVEDLNRFLSVMGAGILSVLSVNPFMHRFIIASEVEPARQSEISNFLYKAVCNGYNLNSSTDLQGTFFHGLIANELTQLPIAMMRTYEEARLECQGQDNFCEYDYAARDARGGKTLLLMATLLGKEDVVGYLLGVNIGRQVEYDALNLDKVGEHHVDVIGLDVPDDYGRTPLMIAAAMGKMPLVQRLLAAGANPHLRDYQGRSAHDWLYNTAEGDVRDILDFLHVSPDRHKDAPHNVVYVGNSDTPVVFDVPDNPHPEKLLLISNEEPYRGLLLRACLAAQEKAKRCPRGSSELQECQEWIAGINDSISYLPGEQDTTTVMQDIMTQRALCQSDGLLQTTVQLGSLPAAACPAVSLAGPQSLFSSDIFGQTSVDFNIAGRGNTFGLPDPESDQIALIYGAG